MIAIVKPIIPIKIDNDTVNPFYILGLINSTLMTWYHHKRNPKAQKGLFPKILVSDLAKLPIKKNDLKDSKEKSEYNEIIKHVDLLLKLNEELKEEKLQTKIEQIKQHIDHSEEKINELVYELYELTPEEIKIVEGK